MSLFFNHNRIDDLIKHEAELFLSLSSPNHQNYHLRDPVYSLLWGNGNRLGPMAYCIAGITSCFIATFVTIASSQGITLSKLNVRSECNINFTKTFDIGDEPITEDIKFEIDAQSQNADYQKLQEILAIAEEKCPAMYGMRHVIKVNAIR